MEAKYPSQMRVMHWLMAAIIVGMLAVGLTMTSLLKEAPLRATLYSLHKSFGVLVLLLCLLRIAFRARLGAPALPETISAPERKLALLGHYAFYFFMLAMPLSGVLMSNAFGFPVKCFGLELPRLIGTDKLLAHDFSGFHSYAAYALMALLVLHVAGVIKHRLKDRVNLLARMV